MRPSGGTTLTHCGFTSSPARARRIGSLSDWNLLTLVVLELVIAAPFRKRKVVSRTEHLECSLIDVDESAPLINDCEGNAYIVESRLKQLWGMKP